MTRISTFCLVSGTLAVLSLSANGASADTITPKNPLKPKVTVHAAEKSTTYKVDDTRNGVIGKMNKKQK